MSWQEELRKLDEELASGRLSADDYRVRRDQVLSSAVSPGENPASGGFAQPQAPQQQPMFQPQQQPPQQPQQPQPGGADATQVVAPVSPPHGTPMGTPQPNAAEATQIVPSADPGADRTQAVPRWQTQAPPQPNYQQPGYQQPQQPQPNSPAGGFAQPGYQQPGPHSGGFAQQHPQQQQPQPGWNQPDGDLSPPWGGSEFPPLSPASSSEWTRQGPELFEESSGKGKGGKVALLALVALLVVGGLVTGGILLFSGDEEPVTPPVAQSTAPPPGPPSPAPPTKSSPKPVDKNAPLIERIPLPPGTADSGSGKLELAQLGEKSIMDGEMVSALNSNGATEAAWRGSVKGSDASSPYPDKFSITAVRLPDAEKAQASLAAITGRMDDLSYISVKDPLENIPSDVQFYKDVNEKKAAYYGVWVSDDVVIQVHVSLDPLPSPANDAEAAMSGSWQRQVIATLGNFPVSG